MGATEQGEHHEDSREYHQKDDDQEHRAFAAKQLAQLALLLRYSETHCGKKRLAWTGPTYCEWFTAREGCRCAQATRWRTSRFASTCQAGAGEQACKKRHNRRNSYYYSDHNLELGHPSTVQVLPLAH